MGLKESGLRGSIRNVSTGIGAAITIDTLEAENIDNESATIRGEITALTNFGEQSEVFFEWGEDSAGLPNTTDIQEQGEVGIFTEDLTGLETGESYEFQAFGSVRDVSDEGAILTFETDDFEIAVTTLEAEDVGEDSATIRGEITELTNFGEDAEVFFEWGEITQGLPNTTDIQLQDTVGVFTEDLTNLSEDTTHEFQAFGSVRDVSDDGVVLTFETGGAIPDSVVDNFERGNFDPYQHIGDDPRAEIITSPTFDGSNAAELRENSSASYLYSEDGDGLDNYPEGEGITQFHIYTFHDTDGSFVSGPFVSAYMGSAGTGNDPGTGLTLGLNFDAGQFEMFGSTSDSESVNLDNFREQWLRFEIDATEDPAIGRVLDPDDDSVLMGPLTVGRQLDGTGLRIGHTGGSGSRADETVFDLIRTTG